MNKRECQSYRKRLVALAENPVGPEAEPELLAHLRACTKCDEEYRWLTGLCTELEAIGGVIERKAPALDLTQDVMEAVARLKQPRVVELAAARRRPAWFRPVVAGLSAAASLAVVAWVLFAGYHSGVSDELSVAVKPPEQFTPKQDSETFAATQAPAHLYPGAVQHPSQNGLDEMRPTDSSPSAPDQGVMAALDMHDVVAARKNAATDPEARMQLAQWATVAAERARELAESNEASASAKLGAVGSLSPEEAERLLLAAIESDPDDPYLRYLLGRTYNESDAGAKAAAEFAAMAHLDPENALAWYELAASYMAQGDLDGALGAFDAAAALGGAYAYTLDAARHQGSALAESGMDAEVARLLAAMTAGTSQYGDVTSLSAQLLDYGKFYEDNGQMDVAEQIYNAVRVFGGQLSNGAAFSNELLAGLDVQREAISLLSGLMTIMQEAETLELLARQTQQIVESLASLGDFFASVNQFFGGEPGTDTLRLFSQLVLGNGDLGLLDVLF